MSKPKFSKPFSIAKAWGGEQILANNQFYCGKILNFENGKKFSMHFHMDKHETWYVLNGSFIFKYIDTKNADVIDTTISAGDLIEIPQGLPHQLIALEDSTIFEVSTTHKDEDSYRVEKGDSQLT